MFTCLRCGKPIVFSELALNKPPENAAPICQNCLNGLAVLNQAYMQGKPILVLEKYHLEHLTMCEDCNEPGFPSHCSGCGKKHEQERGGINATVVGDDNSTGPKSG